MGYSHKNNRRRAAKKVTRVLRKRRLPSHLLPPPTAEKFGNVPLTRFVPTVSNEELAKLRLGVVSHTDVINAILDQEPTIPRGLVGLRPSNISLSEEKSNDTKIPKLKNDEIEYLSSLIKKYDHDYKKMERDIKTNYLQHTAQHLATRIQKLEMMNANNDLSSIQNK